MLFRERTKFLNWRLKLYVYLYSHSLYLKCNKYYLMKINREECVINKWANFQMIWLMIPVLSLYLKIIFYIYIIYIDRWYHRIIKLSNKYVFRFLCTAHRTILCFMLYSSSAHVLINMLIISYSIDIRSLYYDKHNKKQTKQIL